MHLQVAWRWWPRRGPLSAWDRESLESVASLSIFGTSLCPAS